MRRYKKPSKREIASNLHRLLPSKIKIGYADYKIEKRSSQFCEREDMFGDCDTKLSRIRYNIAQSRKELANTILHEILHALFHTEGITVPARTEEFVVRNLANGLLGFIQDNPKFLNWLKRASL